MGATKKRRPTKHRGNAAGMVEARGRTGARSGAAGGTGPGGPRVPKPATWQRAAVKALIPLLLLTPFLFLTQKDSTLGQKAFLLALAFTMYVPLAYYSDRWVYRRFQRQQQR